MRRWLEEMREGFALLRGREFWQSFRAYWAPEAVATRINNWADKARK